VHGTQVEVICKEAADLDVDMIVVGTQGRGAIYQLLMGSISEEIIHKSRYSVLVIQTHQRT
jgi:nucleotide-binding universal stress UspA family protein